MTTESNEYAAVSSLETVLKERYVAEHDRRDKINTGLTLPTTITSALIGAVYYYAIHMGELVLSFWTVAFYVCLTFLVSCLVASMILMLFAYHDRDPYAYIADPGEVAKYFSEWEDYARGPDGTVDWETVEVNFKRFLCRQYSATAQINASYNDRKAWNFYHARGTLVISLLFTLLSVGPYSLSPKKPLPKELPIKEKVGMSRQVRGLERGRPAL